MTPAPVDFEEQAWQQLGNDKADPELAETSELGEAIECVACGKTFLHEASWTNHERSKKHKQALWR